MPKASHRKGNPAQRTPPTTTLTKVPPIKTEADASLLEESVSTPRIAFQAIHPLHLEELTRIWDNDPRMPSATSRRAWALARRLDPAKVNNWWYRRKALAKKLRVRVQLEAYELGVGVPPVIVFKVEDDEEEGKLTGKDAGADEASAEPLSDPASEATCIGSNLLETATSGKDPIPSGRVLRSAALKAAHILRKDVEKSAYNHPSSPTLRCSSPPRSQSSSPFPGRMSSLPPSSPPLPSPSPPSCLLFLPTSDSDSDTTPSTEAHGDFAMSRDADQERAHVSTSHLAPLRDLAENIFIDSHLLEIPSPYIIGNTDGLSCSSTSIMELPFFFTLSPLQNHFIHNIDATVQRTTTDFKKINADADDALQKDGKHAPWCLGGFRVAYDGSLIGLCSRCWSAGS